LRRATLRGTENLTKRETAAALACDLWLLMRKLFGFGTTKQWAAQARLLALWLVKRLPDRIGGLEDAARSLFATFDRENLSRRRIMPIIGAAKPI
jgi:hypothetical protein